MRTIKLLLLALLVTTTSAATAEISLNQVSRPTIRLNGDGQETLLNCPWEKKLTIQLSKEAPAAVIKCIDGGPGVDLVFEGF